MYPKEGRNRREVTTVRTCKGVPMSPKEYTMMNCPVCMNMGGAVNTQLTDLDTEIKDGNGIVEVVFECNFGHEFIAEYKFAQILYK
jgi:hypothetical protein